MKKYTTAYKLQKVTGSLHWVDFNAGCEEEAQTLSNKELRFLTKNYPNARVYGGPMPLKAKKLFP